MSVSHSVHGGGRGGVGIPGPMSFSGEGWVSLVQVPSRGGYVQGYPPLLLTPRLVVVAITRLVGKRAVHILLECFLVLFLCLLAIGLYQTINYIKWNIISIEFSFIFPFVVMTP